MLESKPFATSLFHKTKIKNALTPLQLALISIAVLTGLGIAGVSHGSLPQYFLWVFIAMFFIMMITIICWYSYFAIREPDRLQSEEFQQRKMEIQGAHGQRMIVSDDSLTSNNFIEG